MRDRFDCPRRRLCLWTNKRPRLWRRARIADAHRNRALDGGLNCFWMQDLRSEVSKLGSFAVRQALYRLRFGNDSGIGGEDSSDVGPNLNFTRAERRAEQ